MRKRMIIIAGVAALLISGISVGYYLYNKPRQTAASSRTDLSIDAVSLYHEFEKDEAAANTRFLNKVLEVKGIVFAVDSSGGNKAIMLTTGGTGSINCSMAATAFTVVPGSEITVKGKCAGFLMDVNLVDCILK